MINMKPHYVSILVLSIGTIISSWACPMFSTGERGCEQITKVLSELYMCYECCDIQLPQLPDGILTTNFIDQACFKISSVRVVRVVNNLTTIDEDAFAKATALQVLYLNNLRLTNINITAYAIEHIDLSYNSLTYVNLTRIQKLQHLNLGHNNFTTLDNCHFDEQNNISVLDLSYNRLTDVNWLYRFWNLNELNVSHNQIVNISFEALKRPSKLKSLNLGENLISKIPSDAFSRLSSLTNLNISYNRLTEIDDNLFKSLINLHVLVLSGNKITHIKYVPLVSSMPSLHLLAFDNNPIFCHNAQEMLKYLQHHHVALLQPGACSHEAGGICCVPGGLENFDTSTLSPTTEHTVPKISKSSVNITTTLVAKANRNEEVNRENYTTLNPWSLKTTQISSYNITILIVICCLILIISISDVGVRIFGYLKKYKRRTDDDRLELLWEQTMDQ